MQKLILEIINRCSVYIIFKSAKEMGQRSLKKDKQEQPTAQKLRKAIDFLTGVEPKIFQLENVFPSITIINKTLTKEGAFQKKQDGFYVNQTLLRCAYHPAFENVIKELIMILSKQLKSIMQSRLIALVPRQKFKKCWSLANFCVFFTDQNLLQSINLLGIRTDLHRNTKEILAELVKDTPQLNLLIFNKFQPEQILEIAKVFRSSLEIMINLHLKLISRSDLTLKIVDSLNQSVFILYCKVYFSFSGDTFQKQRQANCKIIARTAAYFLGLGIQNNIPSIYEAAILLLCSVLQVCDESIRKQKAFPSHLFKNIPVINSNQIIDWITYNTLFAMKYNKQGLQSYNKLNVNRVLSLKLLELIFCKFKPSGNQITYILQEICLQTKIGHIQRVYISTLAEMYSRLQNINSEIIKRYCKAKNIKFNVRFSRRSIQVRPEDVRSELQLSEEQFQKQIAKICAKYVIQVIFHKNDVIYEYGQTALWNFVLQNLRQNCNSSRSIDADQIQSRLKQQLNN